MIRLTSLLLLFSLALSSYAEPTFPKLSGRVVDQAGILSAGAERQIGALAEGHENATGNQVVVVTLPDLQGYAIEEYAVQLGRHWKIGQSKENNGVLLIVAQAERKVRIEVGYGLEGELTDAISSNIIHSIITPAFKQAKFEQGLFSGTQGIIDALGGQYKVREVRNKKSKKASPFWNFLMLVIFLWIWPSRGRGGLLSGLLLGSVLSGGLRGGSSGGSSGFGGGGGFSGGGGSFGGGGASGGW